MPSQRMSSTPEKEPGHGSVPTTPLAPIALSDQPSAQEGCLAMFGGLCFDENEDTWTTCCPVENDGTVNAQQPYDKIREICGTQAGVDLEVVRKLVRFGIEGNFTNTL